MSKSLHTEIVINAPKEIVWKVLMDFENYPKWNPFIKSVNGTAAMGGGLKIVIQQPEGRVLKFSPKCTVLKEGEEFRWLGHLVLAGIFDGEHCFRLKSIENGKTKFVQSESFKGILVKPFWKDISTKTVKGFEMMNTALKQRSEELHTHA